LIRGLNVLIVDFQEAMAYRAAAWRTATRAAGLSLGDRACLATAHVLGLRAVTADRRWSGLSLGVKIDLIR